MDTTEQTTDKVENKKEWTLTVDQELRIEVAKENEAKITITDGQAEVFGTELVRNKPYTFKGGSTIAIFTWHGCTVEIIGALEVCYVSGETPMIIYLNVHAAVEQMRNSIEKQNDPSYFGPKVMVCGPVDVGKSTFCRLLLNYAVRMGRRPIYVDLDVGQGSIAVPGTIGALLVEKPADAEEGFAMETPLVYNFGSPSPGKNLNLYNSLVTQLSNTVGEHMIKNDKARVSGCIINTCGWVTGGGLKMLMHTVQQFKVDVVLVIDQERLYNDFKTKLPDTVHCVHLPKSGGVVERSKTVRREHREEKIREYFYGGRTPLYPHVFDVKFDDIKIFKIGAPEVPDSCLPLGMQPEDSSMKTVPISPSKDLLHTLCALSTAETLEDSLALSNVAGFTVITAVDMENSTFTVLSPAPRPLPKKFLIATDIKFMDLK